MKLRPALLALALAASSLAWSAPPDAPARVAQLSYVEGGLEFQAASEPPSSALPDRPLLPGDRLATRPDGRAELAFGTAVMRLDERSELLVSDLDEMAVRVELMAGSASLHLRELLDDESFEIATPNAAIAFQAPGEYRVDVGQDGATEFTVRTGAAEVATAAGPVRVADGQRLRLAGSEAVATLTSSQPADAFDDWVLEREVQFAQAEPPQSDPYAGYGEDTLERYGEWYDDPGYGHVWMSSYAYGGYDPFRYGYWQHSGFGYRWYHPMPWSYYTFYGGRWAYLDHLNRWCWLPARRHHDHDRRVARDTRPFGRVRDAIDLRDDDRVTDARSDDATRRMGSGRAPDVRHNVESTRKSGGGTMVPNSGRESDRSTRSAALSKSQESSEKAARSSSSSSAKRSASSSSQTLKPSRESGAIRLP